MYDFISGILSKEEGNLVLKAFGIWHIFYLLIIFGGIILTLILLRNKDEKVKKRTINITINCAFILYILDFFLMPFAYGYIDIDKLPFHICTLMGVMAFVGRNNKFFNKYITQFTLLGLIGALMYITYPSGVADGKVFAFSYRIVQTMMYHGLVVAHGIFSLAFGDIKIEWKKIYKELIMISIMAMVAVVANLSYSGKLGEFNWFFVSGDPFGIIPENIAIYVMPFIMILVIFIMNVIIYSIYYGIKYIKEKELFRKYILYFRRN